LSLTRHCYPFSFEVLRRTYAYFQEIVFSDSDDTGETFDDSREYSYFSGINEEDLTQNVINNEDAVSFFAYSSSALNNEAIFNVPIRNSDGAFVAPSATSIEDGAYNPLSRRINMNLCKYIQLVSLFYVFFKVFTMVQGRVSQIHCLLFLLLAVNEESSLSLTRPFLEFVLSEAGGRLVVATGYLPITELERVVMRTRAKTESGVPTSAITETGCGPPERDINVAGSSTVFPIASIWVSWLQSDVLGLLQINRR
jgi:ABC-type phosphate transport system substrate-binding protein